MSYIGKYPIPVNVGGTGDVTLTTHGVLIGAGTSAIATTAAGSAGQILVSKGSSSDPGYITPTSTSGSLAVTTNATTMAYALTVPITVANGGTGSIALTANSLLLGNGTSAITALGAATNGQIPIGSTGAAPVLSTITAGTGVTVTNGAGSITIAASGGAGTLSLNGNVGSVSGSTITLTTGAANANGTAIFSGSSATMTMTFSDANSNTGLGVNSLSSGSVTGTMNVCLGDSTGSALTSGSDNVFIGYQSGKSATTGSDNCCIGYQSGMTLTANTSGFNALLGYQAGLSYSGTGLTPNVFAGASSGSAITTGIYNVGIGYNAQSSYTGSESSNISINAIGTAGESNTLRIGSGTGTGSQQLNKTFISGINGIVVTGTAVLISSSNQLGIAVSSGRFKSDVQDMGHISESIYNLRPVTFLWDRQSTNGLRDVPQDRQYGLIAEEVNEILPELVHTDESGNPVGVKYDDLASLLIHEIQKLSSYITELEKEKGVTCHI